MKIRKKKVPSFFLPQKGEGLFTFAFNYVKKEKEYSHIKKHTEHSASVPFTIMAYNQA